MTARQVDSLLDERARLIAQLGASDGNTWMCKELLLEWVELHEHAEPLDFEWLSRVEQLHAETRTVLLTLPDVIRVPTDPGAAARGKPAAPGSTS